MFLHYFLLLCSRNGIILLTSNKIYFETVAEREFDRNALGCDLTSEEVPLIIPSVVGREH